MSDKSKAYWVFIFVGYALILAIPLIGFTYSLELVIILLFLERLGKVLRSPSRDTVFSIIGKNVGSGKAFGIHEAVDQIGATMVRYSLQPFCSSPLTTTKQPSVFC